MYSAQKKIEYISDNIIHFPTDPIEVRPYTNAKIKPAAQPLRTKEQIQQAKEYFLNKESRYKDMNIRDYTILVLGLNLAKRGNDLVNLRMSDVIDKDGNIKDFIIIREHKNGKIARIPMTPAIREALELYLPTLKGISLDDPLFSSRKRDEYGNKKPMTVKNLYHKMQEIKNKLNISESIGTHTLRKTWATQVFLGNPNDSNVMAMLSKALNHSNIEDTFRYIGITQNNLNNLFINNQL